MNKLSISLFSRLYLIILIIIFVSVSLTRFVTEIYYKQEDFYYFTIESNHIFEMIKPNLNTAFNTLKRYIKVPQPYDRGYSAKLVKSDAKNKNCNSCDFIKTIKNITYYEMEEGERLAEFTLPNTKVKVLISEKIDSERSEEELSSFDIDETAYYLLILISSLFMGITIYWPIKHLQTQIKKLIYSHHQFGTGNMSVTADENIQKPLDELAHSFNAMAQAIAENVKERDIFSQAIPHEVRTPLSRIQLASGLIRKKTDDSSILELIDDIENYVVDIDALISQVVEFSRINTGKVDEEFERYQTIEIKSFVKSRLSLLANGQDKIIIIEIADSIDITTNPIYLRLLVDNFIKNALNHSKNKIKISAQIKNGQLNFFVEDDGVGIPPEDRDTIFIPFARLDKSRNRQTGGLGLGLPIAKAAARKMGGSIAVSESELGGAIFSFLVMT